MGRFSPDFTHLMRLRFFWMFFYLRAELAFWNLPRYFTSCNWRHQIMFGWCIRPFLFYVEFLTFGQKKRQTRWLRLVLPLRGSTMQWFFSNPYIALLDREDLLLLDDPSTDHLGLTNKPRQKNCHEWHLRGWLLDNGPSSYCWILHENSASTVENERTTILDS